MYPGDWSTGGLVVLLVVAVAALTSLTVLVSMVFLTQAEREDEVHLMEEEDEEEGGERREEVAPLSCSSLPWVVGRRGSPYIHVI